MDRAVIARRENFLDAILFAAIFLSANAHADENRRGEVHAGLELYTQPVPSDWLVVVTPSVSGRVAARPWLAFTINWAADVVTGATPRTYGRPDVVTAATNFSETRHALGAAAEARLRALTLDAGYTFGIENDYRSHFVHAGAKLDLFEHNTVVALSYGHNFDRVCDLAQLNVPLTLRQPLDSARGCFSGNGALTEEPLDIDTLELSLTQTLSPSLIGALVGSYQHANGFQSNPYRRVRLSGGIMQAQESHPRVRDRGALTLRLRYAIERLRASVGLDLRLYRDTWGVQSLTAEANWNQPLRRGSPWRFVARARGYVQSGADFYRDAGNANSYELAGPVGDFFTADQALAPLADLLLGARFVYALERPPDRRAWRLFTAMESAIFLEYIKIFPLTPEPPNAARARFAVGGAVLGLSATGHF